MTIYPNMSLQVAQQQANDQINNTKQTLVSDFFTYDSHQWACDDRSLFDISGINIMALLHKGVLQTGLQWIDYFNNLVPVDAAYMSGIAGAYVAFAQAAYAAAMIHTMGVSGSNCSADVQEMDFSTLWPDPLTEYPYVVNNLANRMGIEPI